MVAGWFWQEQFSTGFNETISIFGGFIETNQEFHWNHAVFSGFIETISSKKVVSELKFGQKWLKARFHRGMVVDRSVLNYWISINKMY